MNVIEIREEKAEEKVLKSYGQVPIRFQVTSELKIEPVQNGLGGFNINGFAYSSRLSAQRNRDFAYQAVYGMV